MELTAFELSVSGCALLTISLVFIRHRIIDLSMVCFIVGTLFLIKASFVDPTVTVPVMLIYTIAALFIVLLANPKRREQLTRSR